MAPCVLYKSGKEVSPIDGFGQKVTPQPSGAIFSGPLAFSGRSNNAHFDTKLAEPTHGAEQLLRKVYEGSAKPQNRGAHRSAGVRAYIHVSVELLLRAGARDKGALGLGAE